MAMWSPKLKNEPSSNQLARWRDGGVMGWRWRRGGGVEVGWHGLEMACWWHDGGVVVVAAQDIIKNNSQINQRLM